MWAEEERPHLRPVKARITLRGEHLRRRVENPLRLVFLLLHRSRLHRSRLVSRRVSGGLPIGEDRENFLVFCFHVGSQHEGK